MRGIDPQLLFFARAPKALLSTLAFNPFDLLRHNHTSAHGKHEQSKKDHIQDVEAQSARDTDYQLLFCVRPPKLPILAFNPIDWLRGHNRTSAYHHSTTSPPQTTVDYISELDVKPKHIIDNMVDYLSLCHVQPPKTLSLAFNWLRQNYTSTHTAHQLPDHVREHHDSDSDKHNTFKDTLAESESSLERFRPWLWPYYLFIDSTRRGRTPAFVPPPRYETLDEVMEAVEHDFEEYIINPVEHALFPDFLYKPVLFKEQSREDFVS